MGTVYSVIAEDEADVKRRLVALCDALDLVPRWGGRAIQSPGTGRWQATAEPKQMPTWLPETEG